MKPLTVIFIALGLSMDAFAVSVASGLGARTLRIRHILRLAVFFGLFQAVMPVLGWSLGVSLRDLISGVDHWVAFGLLSIIGGKMIYEAFVIEKEENQCYPHGTVALLGLSVATSIDALAIGITLAALGVPVLGPALIIGIITFAVCLIGVTIGKRFGSVLNGKAEVAGGIILLGIGVKILIEGIAPH